MSEVIGVLVLLIMVFFVGVSAGRSDVENKLKPMIEQCEKELSRAQKCVLVAIPEQK